MFVGVDIMRARRFFDDADEMDNRVGAFEGRFHFARARVIDDLNLGGRVEA
jgi:hypothetical protein